MKNLSFPEQVKNKLNDHNFLKTFGDQLGELLNTTKVENGLASEVYKIETNDRSYFFKAISRGTYRDLAAFNEWIKNGILVPSIVLHSKPRSSIARYIMEEINGETIDHKELKDSKKFHHKLGNILRKMHTQTFDGFYDFKEGAEIIVGTTDTYSEMYENKYPDKKLLPVIRAMGLSKDDLVLAQNNILEYAKGKKSVLCHNDLYTHNIFFEENPIIIDPNVDLDLGVMDLGRTMYYAIKRKNYKDVFHIREGYGENFENDTLLSAILIRGAKVLCNSLEDANSIQKFQQRYMRLKNAI